MIRSFACALIFTMLGSVAAAEEIFAFFRKVEGDRVTFWHSKKDRPGGEEVTLPTATNVKVYFVLYDYETKTLVKKETIPDGLKSEVFKDPESAPLGLLFVDLVVDDAGKTITEIKVRRLARPDEIMPRPDVLIQKVEDGRVTFIKLGGFKVSKQVQPYSLQESPYEPRPYEPRTLPVATDARIIFATINEATRKVEVGEAIPGGLRHELFRRAANSTGPIGSAWLVTDAAGEKITEVRVFRSTKLDPFSASLPNSATLVSVENGAVTYRPRTYDPYTNTATLGEAKTLPVAPNVKVRFGTVDAAAKKVEYAEVQGGIGSEPFREAVKRQAVALVTTDERGTVITEICVLQSAPPKKEK